MGQGRNVQAYKELGGQFSKYPVEYHVDNISAYGGMICRVDNPRLGQYVEAFNRYVELLYEK